ncbi:uncharacterized protein LOC126622524 [Malus sylvestris]|uniref:uncharacterized protein LOC126622524 n=1 Tax=Malus sylvestris TaxID=3752 RepID=UPI0021AD39AC|nr:uncharacterized protein LOC126622524 [Malus sylvestris]
MGVVYELMRVVNDELERKHGARWVIKIIEDRWYKTLYHDLHAAAYYLNPRYQYRPGVGDDGNLIRVVHNVYSKLDPASPAVGQFGNELTWFKDARRTFGEPTSVAARTNMSPTEWWIMYGTDAPTVRKLAIKVLSQTASSSACERNWSTFALIHTKQRNKFTNWAQSPRTRSTIENLYPRAMSPPNTITSTKKVLRDAELSSRKVKKYCAKISPTNLRRSPTVAPMQ